MTFLEAAADAQYGYSRNDSRQNKEQLYIINKFVGMTSDSISYSGDYGNFKLLKNLIPEYGSLVMAPDTEYLDNYEGGLKEISTNPKDWEVLALSRAVNNTQDVEAIDRPEFTVSEGLCKIIRNKKDKSTKFLVYLQDVWVDRSPINLDGSYYNFKGSKFSIVSYQENLFLCSGEEDFFGDQTYPDPINGGNIGSAIMSFDGLKWRGIFCGFTGFGIKYGEVAALQPQFQSLLDSNLTQEQWTLEQKLLANKVQPGYIVDDVVNKTPFNPSLIEFAQGRLVATGSKSNPLQIKVGQNRMPFNMSVRALSAQFNPLTTADNDRPWSFKLPAGSDPITGLIPDGTGLKISTKEGWYNWSLTEYKTSTQALFAFDRVTEDNFNFSSIAHSQAYVKTNRGIAYISNSNTYKEFGGFENKNNASGTGTYMQPFLYSAQSNSFLDELNITETTMGVYNDDPMAVVGIPINGTKYLKELNLEGDSLVLIGKTFNLGEKLGTQRGISVLDYINPSHLHNIKEKTYFAEKNSSRVFKFSKTTCQKKSGEILTFDVGVNFRYSNNNMDHIPVSFYIDGYFTEGTKISLIFEYETSKRDVKTRTYSYTTKNEGINDFVLNAIRQKKNLSFGTDPFRYRYMRMRVKIDNCSYCKIQSLRIGYINPTVTNSDTMEILKKDSLETNCNDICTINET